MKKIAYTIRSIPAEYIPNKGEAWPFYEVVKTIKYKNHEYSIRIDFKNTDLHIENKNPKELYFSFRNRYKKHLKKHIPIREWSNYFIFHLHGQIELWYYGKKGLPKMTRRMQLFFNTPIKLG